MLAEEFSAVVVELESTEATYFAYPKFVDQIYTPLGREFVTGPNATAASSRFKQIPMSARLYDRIRKGYRWPLESFDL